MLQTPELQEGFQQSIFFVCLVGWLFFCLFAISRAALDAYGGSQARGPIGAVATVLRQSHSNAGIQALSATQP